MKKFLRSFSVVLLAFVLVFNVSSSAISAPAKSAMPTVWGMGLKNPKVFGHRHQDLDSIACTAATVYLLKNRGIDAEACRLDDYNSETKFVLKYFNLNPNIKKIDKVNDKEQVIMVDHNEFSQSAPNIKNASLKLVIDHHGLSGFTWSSPIEIHTYPTGAASSILYSMLKAENLLNNKEVNALLLSAIISDTLCLTSPTTTDIDREAANGLAKLLGLDLQKYGREMLSASATIDGKSERDVLLEDSKLYEINGVKYRVSAVNVTTTKPFLARQKAFEAEMKKIIAEDKINFFAVMVTDILKSDTELFVLGDMAKQITKKAFNKDLVDNHVLLKGVVSRKKQIVPPITDALK